MAFGGSDSTASAFPRYIGIGAVKVIAVNPTREEWNKLINNNTNTEPFVYKREIDVNGKKIPSYTVSFVVKLDPDKNNGIDTILRLNFPIEGRYHISANNNCEVIDKYGRTAYVSEEVLKTHAPVTTATGKVRVDTESYRPALVGEAALINFIKAQRGIFDIEEYDKDTGTFKEILDPTERKRREAYLADPKKILEGDLKDIIDAVLEYPNNTAKVMFGVRHGDNRDYQTFFSRAFLMGRQRSVYNIKKAYTDAKNNGSFADTDFDLEPIRVWEPKVSDLSAPASTVAPTSAPEDLPFGPEISNPWGFK